MNRSAAHTQLVADALVALSAAGHLVRKNPSGVLPDGRGGMMRVGFKGSADILGVLAGGLYLEAEAKTGAARQNPDQVRHQANVEGRGGRYVLFRSVDELMATLAGVAPAIPPATPTVAPAGATGKRRLSRKGLTPGGEGPAVTVEACEARQLFEGAA